MRWFFGIIGLATVLLAGPIAAQDGPRVVATFTVLGDWAKAIAGDNVALTVLVGPDSDPHEFDPGPRHQREVANADLVIANGLGLEPWLERALEAAGFKGRLLIASAGIDPIPRQAMDGEQGTLDPHAFQDPALAEIYVVNIRDALQQVDPAGAGAYAQRASGYLASLRSLAKELRAGFDALPPERRKVLTSHDAFAYFGRAFGIEFVPVLAGTAGKDSSAGELAAIVEQARGGGIAAIFLENMIDPRLAEAVASDSGVAIGGVLYADALSAPDGPAASYLELLRHNAQTLLRALR